MACDFNESTAGVEGSCPTGVDMCSIVVVENPDEVSTLQLGGQIKEKQGQRANMNYDKKGSLNRHLFQTKIMVIC